MPYILNAYDEALELILKKGIRKPNRTGVDTLSVFGIQSRYRIDENFPILTRRKVWPKSIFAELLWFISGSSNNKDLQALGSNIWTPWVDKKFEQEKGYVEGALGPVYGFQLRHFGGYYGRGKDETIHMASLRGEWNNIKIITEEFPGRKYGQGGFDQLQYMINELRNNPDSRRNLFSLWNPAQLDKMRLPPCHYTFQVYTEGDKLSGMLTQRSCDFPIGVPANIQFYSALLYLLAQQTGFKPYEFIHSTADSHIYVNQIQAVEEYLSRPKPDSPRLEVKQRESIESYHSTDFLLKDYHPLEPIKIPVAV